MILWHSIFINLYANINVLECACGREGYGLAQMHASSVRSWIQSPDAKRALLHAMLLQRAFEALPAGAEPAIHVPLSLYHCGIVWACFLHFEKVDGGQQGDKEGEGSTPVSLSADDARHFEELHLPGVDGIGILEQLGTVSPGRLALGSLFRIIDLLQRINHFKVSQSLATTLLALVEEMQGLF